MSTANKAWIMINSRWINRLLDASILFSFDKSGYRRHRAHQDQVPFGDVKGRVALVTGANSGIGFATAQELCQRGVQTHLVCRNEERGRTAITSLMHPEPLYPPQLHVMDMAELQAVDAFAQQFPHTLDVLVHNAGAMPDTLGFNSMGDEQVFASQVLAPFILTQTLMARGKLAAGARVIFVSSGGMYLHSLDLSDLQWKTHAYNKYLAYANAKRAQVMLSDLFARHFPAPFKFSTMHPGWVDTPGVKSYMPWFYRLLKGRLRTIEEGADTILWLALTSTDYPSGRFWFDRSEAPLAYLKRYAPTDIDYEQLWSYCQHRYEEVKKHATR